MKGVTLGLFAALSVGTWSSASQGAVLLTDDFDSYVNGSALTDNGWTDISGGGNLVTNASPTRSAPHSVEAGTADLRRSEKVFTESGNVSALAPLTFSFDFFDSNAGAAPYRQFANLQDGALPQLSGQLVSMGLHNNMTSTDDGGNYYMARILGYDGAPGAVGGDGASAYFKLNQGSAPLRSTGWHNLKAVITATNVRFYVDGILAATETTTILANDSYERVRIGSGATSNALARFDNVFVDNTPIPEPASLALVGLVGAALLSRRRRTCRA